MGKVDIEGGPRTDRCGEVARWEEESDVSGGKVRDGDLVSSLVAVSGIGEEKIRSASDEAERRDSAGNSLGVLRLPLLDQPERLEHHVLERPQVVGCESLDGLLRSRADDGKSGRHHR